MLSVDRLNGDVVGHKSERIGHVGEADFFAGLDVADEAAPTGVGFVLLLDEADDEGGYGRFGHDISFGSLYNTRRVAQAGYTKVTNGAGQRLGRLAKWDRSGFRAVKMVSDIIEMVSGTAEMVSEP